MVVLAPMVDPRDELLSIAALIYIEYLRRGSEAPYVLRRSCLGAPWGSQREAFVQASEAALVCNEGQKA